VTRSGEILLFGNFLLEQYLHFQPNKQLQNMVSCTYFNNQKDSLATVWATFPNIGRIFV
jgi:hypothetical protein